MEGEQGINLTNSGAFIVRRLEYFIFTITEQALSSADIKSESLENISRIICRYL